MSKSRTVIGITGGISTGKSTFAHRLHELTGAQLFDADRAARELADEDPEVRRLLRKEFGAEIFSGDGMLNRAALRVIVFADSEKKRALENILHPRIRRQWATAAEVSRQSGTLFLADIPLLYETEGESLCDRVIVVACSQELQLQRLIWRAHLSSAAALAMIESQMSLPKKISRADHLVWNNGPLKALESQAGILAQSLVLP
ncbi:MAG: dephospho-CoA kinase [Verrucomicrobiota bacterium]|nr:dephospho-CoA kinase [Verrucomicrobiota bacterium]